MSKTVHLSVVTPVYGCALSLKTLYERLVRSLSKITEDFEIIMVNDASPDNAWEIIQKLAAKDSRVKGIKLSRNFGQHRAITAGLDYADGEWVVVMDCDLQDQPEEILKLYEKAQEGFDIVFGRRRVREDSIVKKVSSKIFYILYEYFTEIRVDSSVGNFSIVSSQVVRELRKFKEQNRFFPVFVSWLGFKRIDIDIRHAKRLKGKSAYTFRKLVDLALDVMVSQSNKPLKLSIKIGFSLSFASILYGMWLIARYFLYSVPVEGWTSVMVSIYFIAGLLLANMGILGLYLGKVFDETKERPLYVVQEITGEKA